MMKLLSQIVKYLLREAKKMEKEDNDSSWRERREERQQERDNEAIERLT